MNESIGQTDDIKEIIASNLVSLRQEAGLTQLQLAEMLNYSDKAVSKWERGESIPDLRVLIKLADIYHISLDDIVRVKSENPVKPKLNLHKKRVLITLLSVGLVAVLASVVFMIFFFIPQLSRYAYLAYVCAPFAASVVFTAFAAIWYRRLTLTVAASLVLWTAMLIIQIVLMLFTSIFVWPFYIAAAIMQVLIIGWFVLRKLYKPEKKN